MMFQENLLNGSHILVTGGGSGLGYSMTRRFLALGAEVTIWGRRRAVLDEAAASLADETGGRVHADAVDIRDPDAIEAAVDRIWAHKPLTGLVNNAAGNFIAPTESLSPRAFNAIASIVFHGTFMVTNACARRWLDAGDRASVISILTTWVWTGSPFVVPSAMSKAGLDAMTKSLAVEWGPRGLRFNAIAPGPFPTKGAWDRLMPDTGEDLDQKSRDAIPMKRYGDHSELANLAAFLLADQVAYINGQTIAIDGGQHLNNAGSFAHLWDVTPEQWEQMRAAIETANKRDKAGRA
ncbi:SDR family oxidoreductase [Rhodothalassium salexigens]|uniref:SDR family oxidoreductase n=1 Tax=Rhodothalassium salexigens TaxID=1086 RepID=UPI001914C566|nr:SDR family oxidoreductase [Rhodothalassium salexigens]